MANRFKDATLNEVDNALQRSWEAFKQYRKLNLRGCLAASFNIARKQFSTQKKSG